MAFDYMSSIEETIVVDGFEGKIIMVYGGNNLGKSLSSSQFPSPITLPLEPNALNAIGGAHKLPVHNWAQFSDFTNSMNKDKETYEKALYQLEKEQGKPEPKGKEEKAEREERLKKLQDRVETSPYAQFKARFTTLVLDSLTALAKSAEKYVTDNADVIELSDVSHGKLYKRFENEVYHTINMFFNLGNFTYLVLAHEDFKNIGTEKDPIMQAIPKGDWKRVVKPVVDRCDIIVYLRSNGVDENKRVIKSSGIMAECDICFARTKWDNMDLYLPEYSAQSLEEAIKKAINEQRESGVKVGTFREQQKSHIASLTVDTADVKRQIKVLFDAIYAHDDEDIDGVNVIKFQNLVAEYLGEGKYVSDASDKQVGQLQNILSRAQDIVDELV